MEKNSSFKTLPFFVALFIGLAFSQLPVLLAALAALAAFPGLRTSLKEFFQTQLGPLKPHYQEQKNLFLSMLVEFPLLWAICALFGFLQQQVWQGPRVFFHTEAFSPIWLITVMVICLPVIEEVLFRKELQGLFVRTKGILFSLFATAIGFALFHPQNILGYFLLGYVMSVYAFKSQKLWLSFFINLCYNFFSVAFTLISHQISASQESQHHLVIAASTVAFTWSIVAYFLTRKHVDYKTIFKIDEAAPPQERLFQQPIVQIFTFGLMLVAFTFADYKFGASPVIEKWTGAPFSEVAKQPPSLKMDFVAVSAASFNKKQHGMVSNLHMYECEGEWEKKMNCFERSFTLVKKEMTSAERMNHMLDQKWDTQGQLNPQMPEAIQPIEPPLPGAQCLLYVSQRQMPFEFIGNEWQSAGGERKFQEIAKTLSTSDESGKAKYLSVVNFNKTRLTSLSPHQWRAERRSPSSQDVSFSEKGYVRAEVAERYSMHKGDSDSDFSAKSVPPEFLKGCQSTRISFVVIN